MYGMVLMAAMTGSPDAATFGKRGAGCNGCLGSVAAAPAGCTGVVTSSGCTGRGGFLGHHRDKGGCSGTVISGGCTGTVIGGYSGGTIINGGCTGTIINGGTIVPTPGTIVPTPGTVVVPPATTTPVPATLPAKD